MCACVSDLFLFFSFFSKLPFFELFFVIKVSFFRNGMLGVSEPSASDVALPLGREITQELQHQYSHVSDTLPGVWVPLSVCVCVCVCV